MFFTILTFQVKITIKQTDEQTSVILNHRSSLSLSAFFFVVVVFILNTIYLPFKNNRISNQEGLKYEVTGAPQFSY